MPREDFAVSPFPPGKAVYGHSVAESAICPEVGDVVAVRSLADPHVEFEMCLTAAVSGGTWRAVVFSIGREGWSLEQYGGVGLEDEVEITTANIISIFRSASHH